MLQYLFIFAYAIICLLLLLVVLLQQGKGGDIASAFGGSSSQAAFGARAGATLLTKATTVLGVLFMVGALALALVYDRGNTGGSLMSGTKAPARQSAPAKPAPRQQTPPPAPPSQPQPK